MKRRRKDEDEEPIIEGRFLRARPCPKHKSPGLCLERPCDQRPTCRKNKVFNTPERDIISEILACRGPQAVMENEE